MSTRRRIENAQGIDEISQLIPIEDTEETYAMVLLGTNEIAPAATNEKSPEISANAPLRTIGHVQSKRNKNKNKKTSESV